MSDFNFGLETFNEPELTTMLTAARKFAGAVEANETPRWLTMTGKSGTGKTHIAKRLYLHWKKTRGVDNKERGGGLLLYSCDFIIWPVFSDDLKDGKHWKVKDACEYEFLVIDEIGVAYDPSGFLLSKLDQILNRRLGKWTVITSNLSRALIAERLDSRIASRLVRGGGELVELTTTKDYGLRARGGL